MISEQSSKETPWHVQLPSSLKQEKKVMLCVTSDTPVESTKDLCAELANNSTVLRLSVVSTVSKSGFKEAFS